MREPNYSFPSQNRAAVVISSALYDRRALDCTATLPLVNSLTHLAYMTSTSPRIREILATDGGLERLVKILATCQNTDRHSLWKWSLAFQCLVNVGVRGTESIRTRVVETGAVHIVLAILHNFQRALEKSKQEREQDRSQQLSAQGSSAQRFLPQQHPSTASPATALSLPIIPLQPTQSRSTPITPSSRRVFGHIPSCPLEPSVHTPSQQSSSASYLPPFAVPQRRTFLTRTPKPPKPKPQSPSLSTIPLLNSLSPEATLHREEDVLMSLQLLAYLSKYPHIREAFHNNYGCNVFSVVEKFTHRSYPPTIMYWAGVIMRNACRKDEGKGGLRQCAYMHCGKWERYTREFAKCRRCRKAKYCSKNCQSKAWAEGHRWWCVERHQSSHPPAPTTTSTTAVAAAAAVVAAAPQPMQTDQVVPLTAHGGTPDVLPITIEDHPSDLAQGDPDNTMQDTTDSDNPGHILPLSLARDHSANNRTTPDGRASLLDSHPIHRRRRNSRFSHSVPPSGSSTEVEADVTGSSTDHHRDLMEID